MQKKKNILFCMKRYYLTKMSLFSSTQMLIYLICKMIKRILNILKWNVCNR